MNLIKLKSVISVRAVLTTVLCMAAYSSVADHDKELAEVKAGLRKEAKASWWGFNKEDSTRALQDAINSGVRKLVVDNTGHDWVIESVNLADNQEIVFEKGVIVTAKKDCFKKLTDCLFTANRKRNIVLRGEDGVVLKMRKSDYRNPSLYKQGEWRHAISLMSSENISILNLTIQSSGGDGIYVGVSDPSMNYCKNILIDHVVADDNHRQGISIISAENLIIRNSIFKNTIGTAPEGGIDFEPNHTSERLVNCLVENCKFINNKTFGVVFCLRSDTPISIVIRNCEIADSNKGLTYAPLEGKLTGTIEVADCKIFGSSSTSVFIDGFSEGTFILRRCTIDNTSKLHGAISLLEKIESKNSGKVIFDEVSVVDNIASRPVFSYQNWIQHPKTNVEGVINYLNKGVAVKVDCSLIKPPSSYSGDFKVAKLDDVSRLTPPAATEAGKNAAASFFPVRYNKAKFLQYAVGGQQVTLKIMGFKVGRLNEGKLAMCLKSPRGKEIRKFELSPDNKFVSVSFTAEETGLYSIECLKGNGNAFVMNSDNRGNGYLIDGMFKIVYPRGRLFFQVPAGVKDIKIQVFGEFGETVDVALLDQQGKKMDQQKGVEALRLLKYCRPDASRSEVWALEFSNAVEDCAVCFGAPLVPAVSTSAENLLLFQ
ncbi:MAG: right-handed parallel beta-helix repeat-containing protein [Victivallaceae bacterium]|jgi:hypothetical protein